MKIFKKIRYNVLLFLHTYYVTIGQWSVYTQLVGSVVKSFDIRMNTIRPEGLINRPTDEWRYQAIVVVKGSSIFYVLMLLQISELSHTVINALSFRVEYRRGSGGTAMFQRQVRFQIDLSDVTNTHSPRDYLFAIIFTLHSGTYRSRSANKRVLLTLLLLPPTHDIYYYDLIIIYENIRFAVYCCATQVI